MGLVWSPDSKWLAYAKSFPNNFRRIVAWNVESGKATPLTGEMADATNPAWDRDGRHLWFLAATNLGLGAGWANTSSIRTSPTYSPYVMVLRDDDTTPFPLRSDEEPEKGDTASATPDSTRSDSARATSGASGRGGAAGGGQAGRAQNAGDSVVVRIDFDGIDRRIIALPMPERRYVSVTAGPKGSVFIGEVVQNGPPVLHRFTLEGREAQRFAGGVSNAIVSADGKKMLYRSGANWHVVGTNGRRRMGRAG